MDIFLKAVGGVIVTLIIYIVLSKQNKDMSTVLTVAVCSIVAIAALNTLSPIIEFIEKLQALGKIDNSFLKIIFRAVGIGILSEITTLICNDAGNGAMGKALQLLGGAVVICISVPLFQKLIELIEELIVSA